MLTKKHYNPIAEDLQDTYLEYVKLTGSYELAKEFTEIIVDRLCRTFMYDNDRFSASMFKDKVYELIDAPYEEVIIISDQLHNRNRYKILEQELEFTPQRNLLYYNIRKRVWYDTKVLDYILIKQDDFKQKTEIGIRSSKSYLMANVVSKIHGYNNLKKIILFVQKDMKNIIQKLEDMNSIFNLDIEIISIEYPEGD